MSSCQCQGIEQQFGPSWVRLERQIRRLFGRPHTTKILIDAIRRSGVEGKSLIDIGGGLGEIQHALAEDGAARIESVEGASAYLDAAREEAERRGYAEWTSYRHGDFVELADDVPPADIVTLDRVICCYDDVESLIARSTERCRERYGLVYPRDIWWSETARHAINLFSRVRRNPYRFYLHSETVVGHAIRSAGFVRMFDKQTLLWNVELYRRRD